MDVVSDCLLYKSHDSITYAFKFFYNNDDLS